jgi:hypothetical protein
MWVQRLITPTLLFKRRYLFNALLLQWTVVLGVILMAEFVVCAYHYISPGELGWLDSAVKPWLGRWFNWSTWVNVGKALTPPAGVEGSNAYTSSGGSRVAVGTRTIGWGAVSANHKLRFLHNWLQQDLNSNVGICSHLRDSFFCCATPATVHVLSKIYVYKWFYFVEYLRALGLQGTHAQISNVILMWVQRLITPTLLFKRRYLLNALLL